MVILAVLVESSFFLLLILDYSFQVIQQLMGRKERSIAARKGNWNPRLLGEGFYHSAPR